MEIITKKDINFMYCMMTPAFILGGLIVLPFAIAASPVLVPFFVYRIVKAKKKAKNMSNEEKKEKMEKSNPSENK